MKTINDAHYREMGKIYCRNLYGDSVKCGIEADYCPLCGEDLSQ